ncbi:hypothetical protein [Ulvibacterium sp.]|uniref:hypothetical protein n=1 Tax=Ulvibacterium sp. TaxID=2665914 RepID=UPI002613345C|nr:hypothetical protein [Ulvibacterium sp.]
MLFALCVCLPLALQGQETLHYAGALQVGKYKGEAGYDYKVVGQDTLLNGPFIMERSNLEALLENEDSSFLFSGTFKDNFPEGFWRFQFGEFQSNSETQVIDYQYRVLISGTQEETSGTLKMGKPDGPWTYTVQQIKDSEVEKTLFKSSIVFEDGIPQRSFRVENENSTLVGRFLRNGLAHDEWSLYATDEVEAVESWFFNNGLLQKIQNRDDNGTKVVQLSIDSTKRKKTINLDTRFLSVLQLQLPANDTLNIFESGMPKLLAENTLYYQKIDDILSELGESAFLPEFKVEVAYFPLDSEEIMQLDSIKVHFEKSKIISESLLDNTQLNILKLSDEEALFLYSVVNSISEKFLGPIKKVVDYHEQDILEFVTRDQLIGKLWPLGKPSKEIEVTDIKLPKSFVLPNAEQFEFDGNTLTSIRQLAQYAAYSLDSVQQLLNDKLTQDQRQQELIALEEELIAQSKGLNSLIDSIGNNVPGIDKDALLQIKALAETSLSTYSAMEEVASKFSYAGELVDCYTQLNLLTKVIAELPAQWEEIQQNYQDGVWNPFTATVMNEEVKRRITAAYSRVLVPYFLNWAQSDLSCDNVDELVVLMQNTYQRMNELRNEDTSKLERKLRKEQDPKMVMQLFNIQNQVKEN